MRRKSIIGCVIATALGAAIASQSYGQARGDFDGDGFADLAIGAPMEDIDGHSDSGAVHVIYGSGAGLRATADDFWHLNSQGVGGEAAADNNFGAAITSGDFDGDGFDDMAVSAPFEDVEGVSNAGAVHVLFGAAGGLQAANDQVFDQNMGFFDDAEGDDAFGFALAAGDFNDDGFDDLAVGSPFEDGAFNDEGMVQVFFGSADGLVFDGNQDLMKGSGGEAVVAGDMERLAFELVVGVFNEDGIDDLAVGSPADVVDAADAGSVSVFYGTDVGLITDDDQMFSQNSDGVVDDVEPGDQFGFSLAAGDFDRDGADDLAI